jgi:hypothetical protein
LLNGEEFFFTDDDQGINDTVTVELDGPTMTGSGQVTGNAGPTVVTISWSMGFPNSASASNTSASVSQSTQVLIEVDVDFDGGTDYFGAAAPEKCSASVKLRDNGGPPDSPDNAQASVSCDLGNDLTELDDDNTVGTPGDPPPAALEAIANAFNGRKDIQVDVDKGKLSIKFKGKPGPA